MSLKNTIPLFFAIGLLSVSCSKTEKPNLPEILVPVGSDSVSVLIAKNTGFVKTILKDSVVENIDGLKENYISYLDKQGNPIALYILQVDLTKPNLSIEVGTPNNQNTANSTQRLTAMIAAKNLATTEKTVLAGTNGDYFDFATGIPLGPVHKNNIQIKTAMSSGYKFFGFLDNGNYMIGNNEDYLTYQNRLQEVIGGRHLLLDKGNVVPQTDISIAPRTSVGLINFKKVVMMVVDGRQPIHSVGFSLEQSAMVLKAMGVKDAVNLDGGGSSTLIIKNKTDKNYQIKNKLSEGSERAVANGLFVMQKK